MTEFFEGISWLFENVLLVPLDWLRSLELDSWWGANAINFVFIIMGMIAFAYWCKQLKIFQDADDENTRSKPYLG
ncbi:MAG: uracil phosphoribosyltransferase [Flavobacteriaceae bacterium]|nr:uracil phosphoribosyltransferase [Flavobacteriaceae bacterium]|tara:strand:+ start:670 stop:894 length:225 start_codon:yes stop_codon:yes gene_type:complete